jgi:hypothetical protein
MTPAGMPIATAASVGARPARSWLVPLATAAVLAVAVGGGLWSLRGPSGESPPGYRGNDRGEVRSLVGDDEPLPREDFRLRWSPGPPGSRYDVSVTTESLESVVDARGLAEASYAVPPSALSAVPADGRVLWRVEVALPGGERTASRTFVTRVR